MNRREFLQKVVAAAMLQFLDSRPQERAKMFEKLNTFVGGKKK